MREISYEETDKLYDCLEELAKHHNKVSAHFEGYYPITPSEQRIESFKRYGFQEKSIVLGLCMEI